MPQAGDSPDDRFHAAVANWGRGYVGALLVGLPILIGGVVGVPKDVLIAYLCVLVVVLAVVVVRARWRR